MSTMKKGKFAIAVDRSILAMNLSEDVANERIKIMKKQDVYKNRNIEVIKQNF